MQMSIGSMEMDARIRRDSAMLKAPALIDWQGLRAQRGVGLYKSEAGRGGGQEPIEPLVNMLTKVMPAPAIAESSERSGSKARSCTGRTRTSQ